MSPKTLLPLLLLVILMTGAYFLNRGPAESESDSDYEPAAQEQVGGSEPGANANLVAGEPELVGEKGPQAARTVVPDQAEESTPKAEPTAKQSLRGRVVDEQGQPVADVALELTVRENRMFQMGDPDRPRFQTKTNGRGEFELTPDVAGKYVLALSKGGFIPQDEKVTVEKDTVTTLDDVQLTWAMVLEGRVIDERGAGIGGVKLYQPAQEDGPMIVLSDEGVASLGETEVDGSFRLNTLAPGPWRILAQAPAHRDQVFTGEMPPNMRQSGLLWTLPDGLTLSGRVSDIPAGKNQNLFVRSEMVREMDAGDVLGASTIGFFLTPSTAPLRSDGTFELRGLHPGKSYALGLFDEDKARGIWLDPSAMLTDPITVPSSAGRVNLTWSPKAGIGFQVVDAQTGEPITDYAVEPSNWDLFNVFAAAGDDHPDGRTEVTGLPANASGFDLMITAKDYDEHKIEAIALTKGQHTDLGVIALTRGVLCKLKIVEASTGEPVPRAFVRIAKDGQAEADGMGEMAFAFEGGGMLGMRTFRGRADKAGLVEMQFFPGEPCSVTVKRKGFADAKLDGLMLDAYQNQPLVVKLTEGGTVIATVLDAEGNPVTGIPVKCKPVKQARAASPESGRRVMAASISGGPGSGGPKTNAQGVISFENLTPGDYECTVEIPGEDDEREMIVIMDGGEEVNPSAGEGTRVTVLEGETTKVELYAPTLATIEGVIREDGVPLVGARVTIEKVGGSGPGMHMFGNTAPSDRTDANGRYQLRNVKPGTKVLKIEHDLRMMPVEFIEEIAEGPNTISKNLVVTVVAGRVTDESGTPLPGLTVTVEEAQENEVRELAISVSVTSDSDMGFSSSTTMGNGRKPNVTDEEGRFRLRGVKAGVPLQVVAKGDAWQETRSDKMTLAEGSLREGILLKAKPAGRLSVTVLDSTGKPIQHALVQVAPIDPEAEDEDSRLGRPEMTITDANGIATFAGLSPGNAEVSVDQILSLGPGVTETDNEQPLPKPQEVTIASGATAEVTLRP